MPSWHSLFTNRGFLRGVSGCGGGCLRRGEVDVSAQPSKKLLDNRLVGPVLPRMRPPVILDYHTLPWKHLATDLYILITTGAIWRLFGTMGARWALSVL
jgi:hypothetical protein